MSEVVNDKSPEKPPMLKTSEPDLQTKINNIVYEGSSQNNLIKMPEGEAI